MRHLPNIYLFFVTISIIVTITVIITIMKIPPSKPKRVGPQNLRVGAARKP